VESGSPPMPVSSHADGRAQRQQQQPPTMSSAKAWRRRRAPACQRQRGMSQPICFRTTCCFRVAWLHPATGKPWRDHHRRKPVQ
jgi:hypothetical protein